MIEAHVEAVADCARSEERGESVPDCLQDERRAADVEVTLLLSGEARIREILGGRRGSDGDVRGILTRLSGEGRVLSDDLALDRLRYPGADDRSADPAAPRVGSSTSLALSRDSSPSITEPRLDSRMNARYASPSLRTRWARVRPEEYSSRSISPKEAFFPPT